MALIKCKECGNEISDKATHCVRCGCPIQIDESITKRKVVISQKKMGFFGSRVNIFVYIDNQMIGKTSSGNSISIELPIGKHFISLEMPVNQANGNASNVSKDGKEFLIKEETNEVNINISIKLGLIEGTCNVDEIIYK